MVGAGPLRVSASPRRFAAQKKRELGVTSVEALARPWEPATEGVWGSGREGEGEGGRGMGAGEDMSGDGGGGWVRGEGEREGQGEKAGEGYPDSADIHETMTNFFKTNVEIWDMFLRHICALVLYPLLGQGQGSGRAATRPSCTAVLAQAANTSSQ